MKITETCCEHDGVYLYTKIQMDDCINVFIYYNQVSAKMYIEDAVSEPRAALTKVIEYIKQKYPSITELEYDDMSSINVATEPLPLYYLSIAYNGQTWYEKYFNARMQDADKHAKYRERVESMLSSKPVDYNDFIRICYVPKQLWNELFEYYKTAETYSDFFHAIPKQDRCRLLLPWIDAFMRHHLHRVFSNNDWIIPLTVGRGGGKRKTQRRRGYMPTCIKLNSGYSNNMGISMDDV